MRKVIRYYVTPKPTIRGWYVREVLLVGGHEQKCLMRLKFKEIEAMRYTECKVSIYQQEGRFGIRREYYDEGSFVSSEDGDALYDDYGTAKFEAEEYVETMNGESDDNRFNFVE